MIANRPAGSLSRQIKIKQKLTGVGLEPENELEKLQQALTYLSQEIGHEAWKLGKVLSFQKRSFEGDVVYGDYGSMWEAEGYEERTHVQFKAARENGRWRYFFRHDKWSPWEEYILPWE